MTSLERAVALSVDDPLRPYRQYLEAVALHAVGERERAREVIAVVRDDAVGLGERRAESGERRAESGERERAREVIDRAIEWRPSVWGFHRLRALAGGGEATARLAPAPSIPAPRPPLPAACADLVAALAPTSAQ